MAAETLYPQNTVVSSLNLTGISVNATNGLITATVSSNNADTQLRLEFPTPSANPTGAQTLRAVWDKFTTGQTGTATAYVAAYDGATLLATGTTVNIDGLGIQGSVTFDASLLVDPTGAGLRIEIYSTRSGGGPSVRCVGDPISAVWDANVAEATTPIGQNVEVQWDSRQTIPSDLDLQWDALQAIPADLDTRWDSLQSVAADSDTRWNVSEVQYVSAVGVTDPANGASAALPAMATYAGNAVIVLVSNYTTAPPNVTSVTDTAGNTYTRQGNVQGFNGNSAMECWAAFGITGNASNVVTVNFSGSAQFIRASAVQYEGLDANSFDAQSASTESTPTDPATTAAVTTSASGCLLLGHFISFGGTSSINTISNGQIALYYDSTSACKQATVQRLVGAANSYTTELDVTGGTQNYATVSYAFKPAGSTTQVSADLDTRWDSLQAIPADLDTRWDSLQAIPADLDTRWDVQNATTPVSNDLTARWVVILGFVQSYNLKAGEGAPTIASAPMAVTAGNTLIVGTNCAFADAPVTGVTDTAGNTYSKCGPTDSGGTGHSAEMWVATDIIGHAANVVTVTFSGGVNNRGINVVEYAGLAKTNVYDTAAPGGQTNNPQVGLDHITAATALTDTPNEVILGSFVTWSGEDTFAGADGCVVLDGPGPQNLYMVERVVSAVGTYTINATGGAIQQIMAYCVRTFRAASATGLTSVGANTDLRWDAVQAVAAASDLRWGINTAKAVDVRVDFNDPPAALTGTQTFEVQVRRDAANAGTGTPTVDVELWEAGVYVSTPVTGYVVTSDTGEVITATWAGAAVTNGADVQCRVIGTPGGTGMDARGVDIGSISWDAQHVATGLTPVGANSDLRWDGLAAVSADSTAQWDVLNPVGQPVDLRWDAVASVGQPVDLRWDAVAAVPADLDLRWDAVATVGAELDARWDALATVGQPADLQWDLQSSLSQVGASTDLRWSLNGSAGQSSVLQWGINTAKAVDLLVDFTDPPGPIVGTQTFEVLVRRDSQNAGSGVPTVDVELWEAGAFVALLVNDEPITSDTDQLISVQWESALVTAGADVQCRVAGTVGGTGMDARTVEVGAVSWDALYDPSGGVVNRSLNSRWDVLNVTGSASEQQWNILNPVGAVTDLRWSLVEVVGRQADLRWDALNATGQNVEARWGLNTSAAADVEARWDLLQIIGQPTALQWDIEAAVGRVARNANLRWDLLHAVASDESLTWTVLNLAYRDSDFRYNVLQAVAADANLRWALLERVFADDAVLWDVTNLAGQNADVRWSLLTALQRSLTGRWDILNPVGADASLPWDMLARVLADVELRNDLLAAVAGDATLAWQLVALTGRSVELDWSIAVTLYAVSRQTALRWDLQQRILQDLGVPWSILTEAGRDLDAQWSTLQSVGAQPDLRWTILNEVGLQLASRWDLLGQAGVDLTLQWSGLELTARGVNLRWMLNGATGDPLVIMLVQGIDRTLQVAQGPRGFVVRGEDRTVLVEGVPREMSVQGDALTIFVKSG